MPHDSQFPFNILKIVYFPTGKNKYLHLDLSLKKMSSCYFIFNMQIKIKTKSRPGGLNHIPDILKYALNSEIILCIINVLTLNTP